MLPGISFGRAYEQLSLEGQTYTNTTAINHSPQIKIHKLATNITVGRGVVFLFKRFEMPCFLLTSHDEVLIISSVSNSSNATSQYQHLC
jgi:hypothetical protein